MIYIFGDSWGFSYKQTAPQVGNQDLQSFQGADLASLMMEYLDVEVTNMCERGANMFGIAGKIAKMGSMFNPGDTVYVLQTDPLRSYFVPWYDRPMVPDNDFKIHDQCDLLAVSESLLHKFYQRLKSLENIFKIKIVLHGGIVKPNREVARQTGLTCTDESSTEIICPGFMDNYFVESKYIAANNKYLHDNYDNFVSNISDLQYFTDLKYMVWSAQPELFTHNHTTEAGTRIVAQYLANFQRTL